MEVGCRELTTETLLNRGHPECLRLSDRLDLVAHLFPELCAVDPRSCDGAALTTAAAEPLRRALLRIVSAAATTTATLTALGTSRTLGPCRATLR